MVVLFILMILATGTALDFAEHESERADLQSAVDRGVLAAASMRQTLAADKDGDDGPIEDLIRKYVATRSLSDRNVTLSINEDFQATSREIAVTANYDMGTRFLNMVGKPSLPIAVNSGALEKDAAVEISLIFDTSGSMDGNGTDPAKLNSFKIAAGKFVDQMLSDNDQKKTSMNMVQYDWLVNPGPWMYERVVGSAPTGGQGSCYESTLTDLNASPGTIPALGAGSGRRQIVDARELKLSEDGGANSYLPPASWPGGVWTDICAPDEAAIKYLQYDAAGLFETIGVKKVPDLINGGDQIVLDTSVTGIEADGSTGTYWALQWGLALLNPASQPVMAQMAAPSVGLVDPAFADRPVSFSAAKTSKYVVLLTDGMMNIQGDYYSPPGATGPTGLPTQFEVESAFKGLCSWAKDPTRDITIFTVSYETIPQAEALMNACASPGLAFRADQGNIDSVFEQIADTIERLRLVL